MTSDQDKCGISSILPMSCRGKAEDFARRLHSRLRSLGSQDGSNGTTDESSWLGGSESNVAVSQPRHTTDQDLYFDFGLLESPGSPAEDLPESELTQLMSRNKDNLKATHCSKCNCLKIHQERLNNDITSIPIPEEDDVTSNVNANCQNSTETDEELPCSNEMCECHVYPNCHSPLNEYCKDCQDGASSLNCHCKTSRNAVTSNIDISKKSRKRSGSPFKSQSLDNHGLAFNSHGFGSPFKSQSLDNPGLSSQPRLTSESLDNPRLTFKSEGLPLKNEGLDRHGLSLQSHGLTTDYQRLSSNRQGLALKYQRSPTKCPRLPSNYRELYSNQDEHEFPLKYHGLHSNYQSGLTENINHNPGLKVNHDFNIKSDDESDSTASNPLNIKDGAARIGRSDATTYVKGDIVKGDIVKGSEVKNDKTSCQNEPSVVNLYGNPSNFNFTGSNDSCHLKTQPNLSLQPSAIAQKQNTSNNSQDSDSSDGAYFDPDSEIDSSKLTNQIRGNGGDSISRDSGECSLTQQNETEENSPERLNSLGIVSDEGSTLSLKDDEYPSLEYISCMQDISDESSSTQNEKSDGINLLGELSKDKTIGEFLRGENSRKLLSEGTEDNLLLKDNAEIDDDLLHNKEKGFVENKENLLQKENDLLKHKEEDFNEQKPNLLLSSDDKNLKHKEGFVLSKNEGASNINVSNKNIEIDNLSKGYLLEKDDNDILLGVESQSAILSNENLVKQNEILNVDNINIQVNEQLEEACQTDLTVKNVEEENPLNDYEYQYQKQQQLLEKDDETISEYTQTSNEDENDERIPRVRRCSSLKTGKTPPGTPGRKKIVRFADVLGLDLADVRTFLDEIPKVPTSAYNDLVDADLTDSSSSELKYQLNQGHTIEKVLVPLFQQPGGQPDFLERVKEGHVCLENAIVDDPVALSIKGTVRVRNLDFNKSVHIRYSLDSWRSFADMQGQYVKNSCDGFTDTFSFLLYAHTLTVGQRLEFAVRFHCKGCQYWDNNRGANYCFQCLPATNSTPYMPITGLDDSMGAAFYYGEQNYTLDADSSSEDA